MRSPKALDEMTREEFDDKMAVGLAQAKANRSALVDEVFTRLTDELEYKLDEPDRQAEESS